MEEVIVSVEDKEALLNEHYPYGGEVPELSDSAKFTQSVPPFSLQSDPPFTVRFLEG